METYTWSPEPVHTPLTWTIWGILTATLLLITVLSLVVFGILYKKSKREILSINRIAYFSIFLSLFLIQSIIMMPLIKLPIPFSFNSIIVIAVGFIYGPIEGIVFGLVADSLKTLINGWTYQILPSLIYPIIGLTAGLAGMIYKSELKIGKITSMILFQFLAIILLISLFPAIYGITIIDKNINKTTYAIFTGIFVVTTLIMMEATFGYFIYKDKGANLLLFTLLFVTAFSDRFLELIVTPFNQYFTGFETNYIVALSTRLISTTYLIPTVTITSFLLIKGSYLAMEVK